MLKNEYLKQWTRIVSEKMPHLSIPQVVGLATWSFGMVMTKSSSLTKVAQLIARVNGEKAATVRQRLRQWYEEAEAKKGLHRRSLDVSSCFAPLLMWVLSLLPTNIEQIALALDATTIGSKFVVLSLNILLAGCGIPIAWCVVQANEPGSWKGHWSTIFLFNFIAGVLFLLLLLTIYTVLTPPKCKKPTPVRLGEGGKGEIIITNYPLPITNAPCPMPNPHFLYNFCLMHLLRA
ncbi:hypothetical protein NIES37_04530 [Tolypothrix tenuis PCC 7101]|uniref:Uncharacterized protein n=2 Tax=Tolypothrix TaxID=111782 RepID=A0A1Z4MSS8_9CYAN|nr:hypothetical protein NIES37_04530 [Tolypothrix tenuis PCC 7101]BAZ72973.1 hypothetical protein NIES50_15310 [Aulosira laxa NIES-50]